LLRIIYLLHHTNYNLLRMFYSSLTAVIIHPFYISFLFLHKTLMARNGLLCADVPLRNYSINQSSHTSISSSTEGGSEPNLLLWGASGGVVSGPVGR